MSEQSPKPTRRKPLPDLILTEEQKALRDNPPPHTRVSVENGMFIVHEMKPNRTEADLDHVVKGLIRLAAMCRQPGDAQEGQGDKE